MGLLEVFKGDKPEAPAIDLREVYDATIKDLPDPRFPSHDQALAKAIQDYLAEDNVRKSEIFRFEEARHREPDFYLAYYWIATYHMGMKNYQQAIEVLKDGIAKSLIKSPLCRRLAECYFWSGDVERAIYWFCTAIMAGDQTDYNVYLYLGYIFEAYGLKKASYWARRRGRGISYQMTYVAMEYMKRDIDRITEMVNRHKNEHSRRMLEAFYPFAKKTLGHL
jgi:tetratricopeptide (TPR) repeat protein